MTTTNTSNLYISSSTLKADKKKMEMMKKEQSVLSFLDSITDNRLAMDSFMTNISRTLVAR